MKAIAFSCIVWLSAGTALAQEPVNVLFVTGQADFLQSGHGGTGTVEWLRKTDRRGVQAGAGSGSRADAWWTYARAGGFARRGRVVLAGSVDAGGGVLQKVRFGYQKVAGNASVALGTGRIMLETEGQLAHLAPDLHRILRLGFTWHPLPAVSTGASYHVVSVDREVSPAVSARFDVERGRASILGGAVLAHRDDRAPLLSDIGGARLTAAEYFGGGGLRTGSYRLQAVATVARSRAHGRRLVVSLEIPLKE